MTINSISVLANTSGFLPNAGISGTISPTDEAAKSSASPPANADKNTNGLTKEEQAEVERLKKRDREVRQHENAHLRAAGSLAEGGAQFTFTRGPDGKLYATSGSVSIDTSEAETPEKTIKKADKIVRAALAPAEPSSDDLQVAAKARRMRMEAINELRQQQNEEQFGTEDSRNKERQNQLIKQAETIYNTIAGNKAPGFSATGLATG